MNFFYRTIVFINDVPIKNISFAGSGPIHGFDFGILGMGVVKQGVWFFDFTKNQLVISESINNIMLPKNIKILKSKIDFINRIKLFPKIKGKRVKLLLDLGFGQQLLLPYKTFKKLHLNGTDAPIKRALGGVAGWDSTIYERAKRQKVDFDGKQFDLDIVSYSIYNRNYGLVGIQFLQQFDYVIIDYPNKKFYVGSDK